ASTVDAEVPEPGISPVMSRVFVNSIIGRYQVGPFGRGWSWAGGWRRTLSVLGDGTVTISGPGGAQRRFQPDRRGGFFNQAGDHATLTPVANGGFTLAESNGLVTAFRPDGAIDYVQDTNGNRITAGYTGDLLTSLTHSSG